jgi:Golgi SNAP receptor complex protein 2
VEAVAEEADFLAASLERFGGREARRRREAAERDELLASAATGRRFKEEMDEEAAVAGHVVRSRRALADMFEQGAGILAGMAGSRERIKAAQKKALDVINSIGLGDGVLRAIERRHKADAYVAAGGMVGGLLGGKGGRVRGGRGALARGPRRGGCGTWEAACWRGGRRRAGGPSRPGGGRPPPHA